MTIARDAERILSTYRVPDRPMFLIGTYDSGVTVLSQQIRALNLVWALVEAGQIPSGAGLKTEMVKVAIVGGGFAALTVAAGLLRKGAHAQITLFETRDTLLPLQQGSDTRWLHPHIYDWPSDGSEANSANLPVLNWTAARASDVAVQVLEEWRKEVDAGLGTVSLYCNTRHLHVDDPDEGVGTGTQIEWVGEERVPRDGTADGDKRGNAVGETSRFDLIVIAAGFGLEKDNALSYWRNDTLGQPNLEQPRRTYLVSGQGDGAMIDLLRTRISSYRQDRILGELFAFRGGSALLENIRSLHQRHERGQQKGLFASLEELQSLCHEEFKAVKLALERRLRRDTDVVLHLKVRKISDLFERENARISFQNKLLVYLLYKCGGFFPSAQNENEIRREHHIPNDRVINRHGTARDKNLEGMLSQSIFRAIEKRREGATSNPFSQSDAPKYPGGYFGHVGTSEAAEKTEPGDTVRISWRKEYLPGPTALVATAFCSTLASSLSQRHDRTKRLRVTLHRTLGFRGEHLLQQCCGYFGIDVPPDSDKSAGRTFPAGDATIGLAYRLRRIVRSAHGVTPEQLDEAMNRLRLHSAAFRMDPSVHFLLAMPILSGELDTVEVIGVLFIDSESESFSIDDEALRHLVRMTQDFLDGLARVPVGMWERIRSLPLAKPVVKLDIIDNVPAEVSDALERVDAVDPPRVGVAVRLNFEYSDFIPVADGVA